MNFGPYSFLYNVFYILGLIALFRNLYFIFIITKLFKYLALIFICSIIELHIEIWDLYKFRALYSFWNTVSVFFIIIKSHLHIRHLNLSYVNFWVLYYFLGLILSLTPCENFFTLKIRTSFLMITHLILGPH